MTYQDNRKKMITQIGEWLDWYGLSIRENARENDLSGAVYAENNVRDLLNAIFDYDLENANYSVRNMAGYDLIDKEKKICIQITITKDAQKIRSSLEKTYRALRGETGWKFQIMILSAQDEVIEKLRKREDLANAELFFVPNEDILDFTWLRKEIGNLEIDKLNRVYLLCGKMFDGHKNAGVSKREPEIEVSNKCESDSFSGICKKEGISYAADGMKFQAKLRRGDNIYMGHMPKENGEMEGEPIEWIVLEASDNHAVLISSDIIVNRAFHDWNKDVTWEECTLRKWLNDEFYDQFFSDEEKSYILDMERMGMRNPKYGTRADYRVKDKISLLDIGELTKYRTREIANLAGRQSTGKMVARMNGLDWWLRTPGFTLSFAANVGRRLHYGGLRVDDPNCGVRPVMMIAISGNNQSI